MLLSDIFDTLAFGELSAIAMSVDGEIHREDVPKLINHINRGLIELHKRFELKRKSLDLVLVPEGVRYPIKSPDGDILEILSVMAYEPGGAAYEVVEVGHVRHLKSELPLCFMRMAPTLLRFNHPLDESAKYTVEYKARHPAIVVDDFETLDASKVEIDLPMEYLEALSYYIASRVIAPIDNNLGNPQEGVNYRALFEQACKLLEQHGLDLSSVPSDDDSFRRKGFV